MVDKRKTAKILKQFNPKRAAVMGVGGDQFEIPNHSGDNSAGTILKTPINDIDIPNKKYVDDSISAVDLTGLVPYTGATGDVDLGTNDLTAQSLFSDFEVSIDKGGGNGGGSFNIEDVDGINLDLRIGYSPFPTPIHIGSLTVNGEMTYTADSHTFVNPVTIDTANITTLDLGTNTIVDADVGNWDAH